MNDVIMSTAEAKIVRTPGICGGRPRLFGHRLDVNWYKRIRASEGDKAAQFIRLNWPYLREDQIRCIADYCDASPKDGGVT